MSRDRHHVWYERAWYTSRLDKDFRGYTGFIALTERTVHNQIHAVVKPPIKPNPQVMHQTLAMLGDFDKLPQDNIPRTADFMHQLSERTDDELLALRLQRIGANLLAQNALLFGLHEQQSMGQ